MAALGPLSRRRALSRLLTPVASPWWAWRKWSFTFRAFTANTASCCATRAQHVPTAAILTDNPDFHLRLARHLKRLGVPVFYLVAPQVWAWRQGRVKTIRQLVDQLFCLFPFEEPWFRERGVGARYIGHPLAKWYAQAARPQRFAPLTACPNKACFSPYCRAAVQARRYAICLSCWIRSNCLRQRWPGAAFVLATPKEFRRKKRVHEFSGTNCRAIHQSN